MSRDVCGPRPRLMIALLLIEYVKGFTPARARKPAASTARWVARWSWSWQAASELPCLIRLIDEMMREHLRLAALAHQYPCR